MPCAFLDSCLRCALTRCGVGRVEYEERELWQHAEILYDWDDPGPPCIKETQTRTRFNVYAQQPPSFPMPFLVEALSRCGFDSKRDEALPERCVSGGQDWRGVERLVRYLRVQRLRRVMGA